MPAETPRALARDPGLGALARLNLLPSTYLHESWIEHFLPRALWVQLAGTARAHRHLSALILRKLGLQHRQVWRLDPPLGPLALQEGRVLIDLARHLGLALHARAIARVVDRDGLRRLKAGIGEDGYAFALKRAPFVRLGLALEAAEAAVVEAGAILADGARVLTAALATLPEPLVARIELKLPRSWSSAPAAALDPAQAGRAVLRIIREVEAEWVPLSA